jgi:hypothetical protein
MHALHSLGTERTRFATASTSILYLSDDPPGVGCAMYKHKPRNLVSNGILHAGLQLPEHAGDVTAVEGFV